jgi:hypothetical protein
MVFNSTAQIADDGAQLRRRRRQPADDMVALLQERLSGRGELNALAGAHAQHDAEVIL